MARKKEVVDDDGVVTYEDEAEEPKKGKKEKASRIQEVMNSEIFDKIRKKHGASSLMKASDFGSEKIKRIPTGIFPLDVALGGGFPVGRISMVYGPKSSSKTTSLLKAVGNAQKMCANCWEFECSCKKYREPIAAYFDVEGTFDPKWAACHGINLERLIFSTPEYGEQAFDIAEGLLRQGDCDILVIDSLAFLTPAKEIEEDIAKDLMGVQPRMIGKGIRKFVSAMNQVGNETGRRPTIFFTNQIRMKLGVMFGNPETTPGGNAPGFANSVEVRTAAGKYEVDEESNTPLSVEIRFKIEKNKTHPAHMIGDFKLLLSDTETKKKGSAYDESFIVNQAQRLGLVEGGGAHWKCLGQEFPGKSKIEQELMLNPEFNKKLRDALMAVMLNG